MTNTTYRLPTPVGSDVDLYLQQRHLTDMWFEEGDMEGWRIGMKACRELRLEIEDGLRVCGFIDDQIWQMFDEGFANVDLSEFRAA